MFHLNENKTLHCNELIVVKEGYLSKQFFQFRFGRSERQTFQEQFVLLETSVELQHDRQKSDKCNNISCISGLVLRKQV